MSTLADGTIHQTIHKQPGHGPYLWAVVWVHSHTNETCVTVFSFWEDARSRRDALRANGHVATIDLAVDHTRKVGP